MIYAARPAACRDFPHLAPCTHSLGGRLSSLCRNAWFCPIIYNALESYKHLVGYHSAGVEGWMFNRRGARHHFSGAGRAPGGR